MTYILRIYGNRLLKTLPGQNTRPTPARVREALFNIWQGTITGCTWLDVCAGNGSIGAEALCRGGSFVVGIEKNSQACQIIHQNWRKIATPEQTFQIIRGDATAKLASLQGIQFERVYFDPPYESKLYEPVLNAIVSYSLLATKGAIAVEHNPKIWQPKDIPGLVMNRTKVYGNTALTFYHLHD
ncbi:MAG: 16S rRNA (guanine(966)-N(2))-methyltransferase RsmD [Xenococcaceae cyanobacterium MO_234.B1]|nr:16S rRNA (guanine(966)-N(2))-methyltransferase RsmD [Xenococcaceae cyanobacterium MO_234.B1]